MITVIPTEYKGTRFRSRLEARWAVFFDALGIEWQYEPEAFRLKNGDGYTPDFWLPQLHCFAEVKPEDGDFGKARALAAEAGKKVLLLEDVPGHKNCLLSERVGACPCGRHQCIESFEQEVAPFYLDGRETRGFWWGGWQPGCDDQYDAAIEKARTFRFWDPKVAA